MHVKEEALSNLISIPVAHKSLDNKNVAALNMLEESNPSLQMYRKALQFNVYLSGDNKAMMYAYEKCAKDDGAYRSLALNIERLVTQSI